MEIKNKTQLVDRVILEADEDEVLGAEHTDVLRALAHVLLNSTPEETQRLQKQITDLSDASFQEKDSASTEAHQEA